MLDILAIMAREITRAYIFNFRYIKFDVQY